MRFIRVSQERYDALSKSLSDRELEAFRPIALPLKFDPSFDFSDPNQISTISIDEVGTDEIGSIQYIYAQEDEHDGAPNYVVPLMFKDKRDAFEFCNRFLGSN